MATSTAPSPNILAGMAKKKPTGGKHVTKRVNVGMPEQWHAIARKVAAKRQQPVTFTLIALLIAEAEKLGIADLPLPPWDEEDAAE